MVIDRKVKRMKYLEDYIKEAEEVITRFEESKDLILCCYSGNKLDETINNVVLKKYDSVIESVNGLKKLLSLVGEYETKSKLLDFMNKSKPQWNRTERAFHGARIVTERLNKKKCD